MKIIFFILIIVSINANSFCQDSNPKKKYFAIEGGFNMFIPIRDYIEVDPWDGPDDIASEFKVTPYFSLFNFSINPTYSHIIRTFKKSYIKYNISLGFLHNEFKIKKVGGSGGGFTGDYFNGSSINTTKNDYLFLDLAFQYSFCLKKNLYLTNELGFNTNLLLPPLPHDCIVWYNNNIILSLLL